MILHLGYEHTDNDTRIVEKECKDLFENYGYDITYLTSDKNIEKKGYNKKRKHGIEIIILPLINKRVSRLFDFLKEVKKHIKENKDSFAACHIHEVCLWPLVPFIKKQGIKVIIDMHEDDLHDITKRFNTKHKKKARKSVYYLVKKFEKRTMKLANGVICVTPHLLDRVKKYNKNTILLANFPVLPENTDSNLVKTHTPGGKLSICFAGSIHELWSHDEILKAIESRTDIVYKLAGWATEEYLLKLKEYPAWSNSVEYYGKLPYEEVANIYNNSYVGFCLVKKEILAKEVQLKGYLGNTKMFEYLNAGVPIICTDFEIWKDIVGKYNCGIAVNPQNVKEIKDAIDFILENKERAIEMGNNGKRAIVNEFNWQKDREKLFSLYKNILKEA